MYKRQGFGSHSTDIHTTWIRRLENIHCAYYRIYGLSLIHIFYIVVACCHGTYIFQIGAFLDDLTCYETFACHDDFFFTYAVDQLLDVYKRQAVLEHPIPEREK